MVFCALALCTSDGGACEIRSEESSTHLILLNSASVTKNNRIEADIPHPGSSRFLDLDSGQPPHLIFELSDDLRPENQSNKAESGLPAGSIGVWLDGVLYPEAIPITCCYKCSHCEGYKTCPDHVFNWPDCTCLPSHFPQFPHTACVFCGGCWAGDCSLHEWCHCSNRWFSSETSTSNSGRASPTCQTPSLNGMNGEYTGLDDVVGGAKHLADRQNLAVLVARDMASGPRRVVLTTIHYFLVRNKRAPCRAVLLALAEEIVTCPLVYKRAAEVFESIGLVPLSGKLKPGSYDQLRDFMWYVSQIRKVPGFEKQRDSSVEGIMKASSHLASKHPKHCLLRHVVRCVRKSAKRHESSQLNGTHGEYTDDDDLDQELALERFPIGIRLLESPAEDRVLIRAASTETVGAIGDNRDTPLHLQALFPDGGMGADAPQLILRPRPPVPLGENEPVAPVANRGKKAPQGMNLRKQAPAPPVAVHGKKFLPIPLPRRVQRVPAPVVQIQVEPAVIAPPPVVVQPLAPPVQQPVPVIRNAPPVPAQPAPNRTQPHQAPNPPQANVGRTQEPSAAQRAQLEHYNARTGRNATEIPQFLKNVLPHKMDPGRFGLSDQWYATIDEEGTLPMPNEFLPINNTFDHLTRHFYDTSRKVDTTLLCPLAAPCPLEMDEFSPYAACQVGLGILMVGGNLLLNWNSLKVQRCDREERSFMTSVPYQYSGSHTQESTFMSRSADRIRRVLGVPQEKSRAERIKDTFLHLFGANAEPTVAENVLAGARRFMSHSSLVNGLAPIGDYTKFDCQNILPSRFASWKLQDICNDGKDLDIKGWSDCGVALAHESMKRPLGMESENYDIAHLALQKHLRHWTGTERPSMLGYAKLIPFGLGVTTIACGIERLTRTRISEPLPTTDVRTVQCLKKGWFIHHYQCEPLTGPEVLGQIDGDHRPTNARGDPKVVRDEYYVRVTTYKVFGSEDVYKTHCDGDAQRLEYIPRVSFLIGDGHAVQHSIQLALHGTSVCSLRATVETTMAALAKYDASIDSSPAFMPLSHPYGAWVKSIFHVSLLGMDWNDLHLNWPGVNPAPWFSPVIARGTTA